MCLHSESLVRLLAAGNRFLGLNIGLGDPCSTHSRKRRDLEALDSQLWPVPDFVATLHL